MSKLGALTFAVGKKYVSLARVLGSSLRYHGIPLTTVVGTTDDPSELEQHDLQYIRLDKTYDTFEAEFLAYDLSPYELTLKLDADVYFPTTAIVSDYQQRIEKHSIVSGAPVFLNGEVAHYSGYRIKERALGLHDIYSAVFGFDRSQRSKEFFQTYRRLWQDWWQIPALHGLPPTTDSVYSIVWAMQQRENPTIAGFRFHHMKPGVSGDIPTDWDRQMLHITSEEGLFVAGHRITRPFHYVNKEYARCLL